VQSRVGPEGRDILNEDVQIWNQAGEEVARVNTLDAVNHPEDCALRPRSAPRDIAF